MGVKKWFKKRRKSQELAAGAGPGSGSWVSGAVVGGDGAFSYPSIVVGPFSPGADCAATGLTAEHALTILRKEEAQSKTDQQAFHAVVPTTAAHHRVSPKTLENGMLWYPSAFSVESESSGVMCWERFVTRTWTAITMEFGRVQYSYREPTWELQYLRFPWIRGSISTSLVVLFLWRLFALSAVSVCLHFLRVLHGDGTPWWIHFESLVLIHLIALYSIELLFTIGGEWTLHVCGFLSFAKWLRAVAAPLAVQNVFAYSFLATVAGGSGDMRLLLGMVFPGVLVFLDLLMSSVRVPRLSQIIYPVVYSLMHVGWAAVISSCVLDRQAYELALEAELADGVTVLLYTFDFRDWVRRWVYLGVNTFVMGPATVFLMWAVMHIRERSRPLSLDEETDELTGLPVLTVVGVVTAHRMRRPSAEDVKLERRASIGGLVMGQLSPVFESALSATSGSPMAGSHTARSAENGGGGGLEGVGDKQRVRRSSFCGFGTKSTTDMHDGSRRSAEGVRRLSESMSGVTSCVALDVDLLPLPQRMVGRAASGVGRLAAAGARSAYL